MVEVSCFSTTTADAINTAISPAGLPVIARRDLELECQLRFVILWHLIVLDPLNALILSACFDSNCSPWSRDSFRCHDSPFTRLHDGAPTIIFNNNNNNVYISHTGCDVTDTHHWTWKSPDNGNVQRLWSSSSSESALWVTYGYRGATQCIAGGGHSSELTFRPSQCWTRIDA